MNFLAKEFYLPNKTIKPRILISAGFGVTILLILVVFSPFGMQNIKTFIERLIVAFGYSLIAFVSWLLLLLVTRRSQPEKLKLWKMMVLLFLIQIFIGTLCTIFNNIIFRNPYYFEFFLHFQIIVHLTGIIPTIMLFLFLETSYYDAISRREKNGEISYANIENNYPMIRIEDENPAKSISLPSREIVSISSMDNYLKVQLQKNGIIQKPIVLRGTLKNLENNILNVDHLIRCHRSHVINLYWIQRITGNSLNKKMHMKIGNIEMPISRSRMDAVILKLKQLQ